MIANSTIKVAIADDNIFLAEALAENLNNSDSIKVTKTIDSVSGLIAYMPESDFDILILDINFNGTSSLDYIDQIKKHRKNFKIIALTTLDNEYTRQLAKAKGIDFFKGKNTSYDNFIQTVINCHNSKKTSKVKKRISNTVLINKVKFTQTKVNVLKALYEHSGKTEIEIAKYLNISVSSLKTHKRQLYEMTNTTRIVDLIKFAFNNGILIS